MTIIVMARKMPSMKPLNFTIALQVRLLNGLMLVWAGLILACLGLLLWPEHELRQTLTPELLEKFSSAERNARSQIEKNALVAEPLENVSLNNLALLAKYDGDIISAEKFSGLAAARSARDVVAQSEVIDRLIAVAQFSEAMKHIDGLLRAQPAETPNVFAVVLALAKHPNGVLPVVSMLASEPPWRRNFFNFASSDSSQVNVVYSLLAEMRVRKIILADGELRGFIKNLIDQRNIEKAYFVWLDFLNEKQLRGVKLIYDGEFTERMQNLYFDWTVKAVPGVSVSQAMRNKGQNDQTLMLDFALARPNSNLVEQYVLLPPGNYVLLGEVNARNFRSDNALQWQLRCGEKTSGQTLISSAAGVDGWAKTESDFSVPALDCAYQMLVLRLAEPLNGQQTLSGQIYYDKLRVVRKL